MGGMTCVSPQCQRTKWKPKHWFQQRKIAIWPYLSFIHHQQTIMLPLQQSVVIPLYVFCFVHFKTDQAHYFTASKWPLTFYLSALNALLVKCTHTHTHTLYNHTNYVLQISQTVILTLTARCNSVFFSIIIVCSFTASYDRSTTIKLSISNKSHISSRWKCCYSKYKCPFHFTRNCNF